MAEEREAWVVTDEDKYIVYRNPEAKDAEEAGDEIVITVMRGNRPFPISLTRMTEPELEATARLFARAFQLARPVVQKRDQDARDQYESSEGSIVQYRLYRRLPVEVGTTGEGREHVEGVLFRPKSFSGRERDGRDSAGGTGGHGNGLAPDRQAQEEGREDDQSSSDFTEGLGSDDGWDGHPPGVQGP